MRVPLIIGGVLLALIAVILTFTFLVIGFGSPKEMMARAKLAGERWQLAQNIGFFGAAQDVWLWGRCVRAPGLDEHSAVQRSYLTDAERSCGRSALKRAEHLVVAKGDRARKQLAIDWYGISEALSVPDDFTAEVAYSNRILSGDIPTNLLPGLDSGAAKSGAVLNILVAAWHGNAKAMIRASELLLNGQTPIEEVGMPRELEAYALLLQAKAKGEDVEERIGLVTLLIDTQVRWEVQDWLKTTGRLPA